MFGAFNILLKKRDVVFSEVNGQLLDRGQPISGARIRQRWSHDGNNDQSRETMTDAEGRFRFERIDEPRKFRGPFNAFRVAQLLDAFIDGERVKLWSGGKFYPEENSEYRGQQFDVVCDIAHPFKKQSGPDSIVSRCINLHLEE